MKKKIVIIGAGGHGRVCAEIAELNGYKEVIFLDDALDTLENVSGPIKDYPKYVEDCDFVPALGSNSLRKSFFEKMKEMNGSAATLIHPASTISKNVRIGEGTVVMAGAVVNTGAKIGNAVIINTCASVDHDCIIEDYCHIAVGAHLAGTVKTGEKTFVGAGATVINNITICEDCIIGAGGVVIKDIEESGTYVGVPVRKL